MLIYKIISFILFPNSLSIMGLKRESSRDLLKIDRRSAARTAEEGNRPRNQSQSTGKILNPKERSRIMHKPTLSEVKGLKALFFRSILGRMNGETGYKFDCSSEEDGEVHRIVRGVDFDNRHPGCTMRRVPYYPEVTLNSGYHAGIGGGYISYTRVYLASEEAKRRIRDLFPGHEKFVTWAFYKK